MSVIINSNFSSLFLRSYDRMTDHYDVASILFDERTWSGGFGDSSSRIPETIEDALELVDERHEGVTMFSLVDPQDNGKVIATTGVTVWDYEHETAKMGRTLLSPDYWGRGINHEMKLALMDWMFSTNQIGRIECDVAPRNTNSMRSLENFGFTFEGVKRRAVRQPDGSWRDTAIFSIIIDEWVYKRQMIIDKLLDKSGGVIHNLGSGHTSPGGLIL